MAKVKVKKQESFYVKGKGEMGKPLRKNYEKEQVKMANEGGLYGKKKK